MTALKHDQNIMLSKKKTSEEARLLTHPIKNINWRRKKNNRLKIY